MKKSTEWYVQFYSENKNLVNMHIFLTVLIMPIEIIIFSIFTKFLFRCLTDKNYEKFALLFVYFLLSLIVLQVLYTWKSAIDDRILPAIQIYIRQRYMKNVLQEINDNINTPQIMNHITIMPKYFYYNYDMILKFWIPFVVVFFFFSCFLAWYQVRLGIFSAFYFAGLIALFFYGYKYLVSISQNYFENEENLLSSYENVIHNNESVNSFNATDSELYGLKDKENENNKSMKMLIYNINVFQFIFLFLSLIFVLGLFFYVNQLRLQQKIPTWKFFVFITIVFFMIREIVLVNGYITKAVYQQGSLRNIEIFEETYPTQVRDPDAKESSQLKENYDILLKNVDYSFENNDNDITMGLLKNVTMKINAMDNLLIKGEIGAGKSTLAKIIMRWYKPQKGHVYLNGQEISEFSMKDIRNHQYIMTQNTILFSNLTILENIFYQTKKNLEFLRSLSLPQTFMNILNKKVKKNGVNVSGGCKRLIHVLRCFLHPAKIIILDEPTDNLDERTTNIVIGLIEKLKKIKTIICISHDVRLNSVFDNFYYLTS